MAEIDKSKIFLGCRALGYISTHVPLIARYIKRRKETLLVTSVGKWFHTYGCNHFSLLSVSGAHPGPITCLAGDTYHIYTASECDIFAWRRGSELKHTYKGHKAPVHLILPFGILLISIDEDSVLKIWYIKEEEEHLELVFNNDTFQITTLLHPNTYLNKILLGSEQGSMQLWNIKTSKMIYTFKGWGSSITVLEQAPAVDVAAVGLANGKIILHNLKVDTTIMEFIQDWGLVTSISFRTDGHPIMVTGSTDGHLVLWNLEERRVASQVEKAHDAAVAGAICLPSEPLLATNSADNSIKLWIFDMPDGGARLLRIREGHSSAPCVVRHTGPSGRTILSAGTDSSLRILSSAAGHHPESLGRASYNRAASKKKKRTVEDTLIMPPITEFSVSMQRDKQWDSIAAVHSGLNMVTTWSYNKKRMGSHKLLPSKMSNDVTATCLSVTHCGNFVFIGYSNGEVYKFNMQSGILRGRWGDKVGAHKGPVRGIETDSLNSRLVTAGHDKRLKIWTFKESKLPLKILRLEESVAFTRCHRESSLIALCNEDFSIVLVDMDSNNIVRKFEGHTSKINDACFSHDSRWLITTGMDCTIRTWDIPSAQLVDIFKVDCPCTSLSMAPNGDFLATIHSGQLGVYLWANRTLYAHVNLKPIDLATAYIPTIDLPTSADDGPRETLEEFEALNLDDELEFKSPEQISDELITMSNLPTSRWQNLLNLDVVKQRNKPKAPPKVPKAAPFFLPTISNLQVQFDLSDVNKEDQSKLLIPETFLNLTAFGKLLEKSRETEDYSECIQHIKNLGPSMIDFEISSLSPDNGGSSVVMKQFLQMIVSMLQKNQDFELAQSYLSLFLKTHGGTIVDTPDLLESIDDIQKVQLNGWKKLQEMLMYNLCVVKALKNM